MEINIPDEQINLAICEWRGWTNIGTNGNGFAPTPLLKYGVAHKERLPNHIAGLEALGHMHEAEKRLTLQQFHEYGVELHKMAHTDPRQKERQMADCYYALVATARQRAIALLRVIKPELFQ